MQAIIELAQSNGGLVTAAQVAGCGIARARISEMVRAGALARVQRGVYCLTSAWGDEFLAAQFRFPKGVFSDGTALYLHGYSDRTPLVLTMTFPRAYRASKAREAGIEVRTCADDVLALGLATVRTSYGNEVRAYDLERTLCDMLRGQRVADVQVLNPAMKQYARSRDKDVQKLLYYARALGVEKKIRSYLEVLL